MPRNKKEKNCRCLEGEICYSPIDKKGIEGEINLIELAEFEAMRLCDLEGKSQIEAGTIMNISRGTVQRLLEIGRKKVIDSLLNYKCIKVKKL
ncbi:MAG TPA: hypothetical protein DEP72_01700 [Clostridiales bacterium]|nr:MAG: hypothetical protein A2Y18_07615 [Clostridiales bacterium GWD2_32_19]HCC06868.1 hypothetical protein [Clostridiales bacterium]